MSRLRGGEVRASGTDTGVTVVAVVDDTNAALLARRYDSVRQQTHGNWDLLVLDTRSEPASTPPSDVRVQWISTASGSDNLARAWDLAGLVAVLGRDCWLEPQALAVMVEASERNPEASVFTCDGDYLDARGVPLGSLDRPDWSPRRLRSQHYCDGLILVRGEALRGLRPLHALAGDVSELDLLLRLVEAGNEGAHVRQPLFHKVLTRRMDVPASQHAVLVQGHIDRLGLTGVARPGRMDGLVDVRLTAPPGVRASIVIPTRGTAGSSGVLAMAAVQSILRHDSGVDREFVIVHDADADRRYLADLRELVGPELRVIDIPGPFNFSAKVNAGVAAASGSVLVLLNDDVEVLSPWWLDHMAALAGEPDVGAVGAKLLYPDRTVQHAGHCFAGTEVRHVMAGRRNEPGPAGEHLMDREVVGVTAACMAIRREVWNQIGGMDESLPNNFNDVDLCFRLRARGYRIVQANTVELVHFESRTRKPRVAPWEVQRIQARLGRQLQHDPYTLPAVAGVRKRRGAAGWANASAALLREEGVRGFARKGGSRLAKGRAPAADITDL